MIYLGIGALFGFSAGVIAIALLGGRHAQDLHLENEELRGALRHVRGAAMTMQLRGVTRYIDRVLSDEAGA